MIGDTIVISFQTFRFFGQDLTMHRYYATFVLCINEALTMMKKFNKAFIFLIGLSSGFMVIFSSCDSNYSSQQRKEAFDRFVSKAQKYAAEKSDSCLIYADSAIGFLAKANENDTAIIPLMRIKADFWGEKDNSDSAISIYKRTLNIAVSASDTLALAQISFELSELFIHTEDYIQAETYIQETATCYEKLKDELNLAAAYGRYGMLLLGKKNNIKAHEYLMKAFTIFENLDSLNALGWVCTTIADNYNEMNDKTNATKFYKKAISNLERVHDTSRLTTAWLNMGVMYRNINPDSAMACYRKAISLHNPDDTSGPPVAVFYNIANLYLDQKQYAKAIAEYDKVLQICRERKLAAGIARVYSGYASVYIKQGNLPEATKYDKLAVQLADSLGFKSLTLKLLRNLKVDYQDMGDYKNAYDVSERVREINETILAEDNKAALENLEKLSKAEKKVLENTILKNEIQKDKEQLFYRQIIIGIMLAALLFLTIMFWKNHRLHLDRAYAYEVLIKRYKEEIKIRKKHLSPTQAAKDINENEQPLLPDTDMLVGQMINWFNAEKPYLNPKLRVDEVAEKLNTSQKAIALALKTYNNSNFNSFTNTFRIEEARKRLEDASYNNYKIDAIGSDCGFGSKQSFYSAFEQVTGLKPGYYRSQLCSMQEAG